MTRRGALIAGFIAFDVIVAVLVVAPLVMLPETARVERKVVIDVPPCKLHEVLMSPSRFASWSPWPGAELAVIESQPCGRVKATLERPGPYGATFEIAPNGGGSLLSWSIDKSTGNNPIARVVGALLEDELGPQLAAGLLTLKSVAEGLPIE